MAGVVQTVLGEYEILGLLGQGGGGSVYRARHTATSRLYALKTAPLATLAAQALTSEAALLTRLAGSRHVVHAIEAFESAGLCCLVLEYMDGLSVDRLLKPGLDVACILHIARGVLGALRDIHRLGMMHRDVKAANILCDRRGRVVLGDFGASAQGGTRETLAGTPDWLAPELLQGPYSASCDIWALGVTLCELTLGATPFALLSPGECLATVRALSEETRAATFHLADLPPVLASLVEQCTRLDPSKRPTAAELLEDESIIQAKVFRPCFVDFLNTVYDGGGSEREDVCGVGRTGASEMDIGSVFRLTLAGLAGKGCGDSTRCLCLAAEELGGEGDGVLAQLCKEASRVAKGKKEGEEEGSTDYILGSNRVGDCIVRRLDRDAFSQKTRSVYPL